MSDFDGPWKEALDHYFEAFLLLLFPDAHRDIDWSRGYERLDKELRQVIRDAEAGGRVVDFLAKVWLHSGEDAWVFVHIEVQGKPEAGFGQRLFTCNYRIFDLYQRPVASLAVLADESPSWRPDPFGYNLWDCRMAFEFPSVKLLDFAARADELEKSLNPFAVVVLAHLETLASRHEPGRRGDSKFRLVRSLYGRGMGRDDVRRFFRIIDWMMDLPKELEKQFRSRLETFEQEQAMPYVTSIERLAKEEGIVEGLSQGRAEGQRLALVEGIDALLEVRFGEAGVSLMPEVRGLSDVRLLQKILSGIKTAATIAEVRTLLQGDADEG